MAIPATTKWNVQTDGADTNGGAYVPGTTGTTTDYSVFANKNASGCSSCGSSTVDLSTTDAVANGTTTITSATANFSAAKGNIVYFSGGSGSITGVWRQVVSVTNSTTIVLDASIASSTGMTMNIGGALLTPTQALANVVASNKIYIKAGTYTKTTTLTVATGGGASAGPLVIEGYGSTQGDLGTKPLLTTATNSIHIFTLQASYVVFCNLALSSTAGTRGDGVRTNAATRDFIWFNAMKFSGFARAINFDHSPVWFVDNVVITDSEFDTNVLGITSTHGSVCINCYFHGNSTAAISAPGTSSTDHFELVIGCTFYNNAVDWNQASIGSVIFIGNNFASSTGAESVLPSNTNNNVMGFVARNNIWYGAAGYGINNTNATPNNLGFVSATSKGNAYGSNASGNQNWVANDITLSADPWTGRTSADYTLNATAGGGADLKGAGFPGVGLVGTGYADVGAVQSQGTGGGGGAGMLYTPSLDGV